MFKIKQLETLNKDIEDLKSLMKYEEYGLNTEQMKLQLRGIILNLQDHVNELLD